MKPSGIGGQAVIEGIMMRNKNKYSIAVRKPDNEIEVIVKESIPITVKYPWTNVPIIRGIVSFVDSLVTGISTINYSASFYDEPMEQKRTKLDEVGSELFKDKFESILMAFTVVLSICLAVILFMVAPYFGSRLLSRYIASKGLLNLFEGLIRLVIFVIYILLISLMKDIKRTFMYHGAEHKCINCIENGVRLTPENVKNSSRYHRRCGTSFLFLVMFISVIFFIFINVENTFLQIVIRLLLVPVIAGVSYEFIRWAGKADGRLSAVLSAPGMWFQKLTTKEPDMDMIEVAIKAVEEVFDWKEFLIEYYKDTKDPMTDMVAKETELAISSNVSGRKENTRSIVLDNQNLKPEEELRELTPEERYINAGKEYGFDDDDRDLFDSVYEISDESESTIYDNGLDSVVYSSDDSDSDSINYYEGSDAAQEEQITGFEFDDTQDIVDDYPEEVPMFKQRHEK